MPQCYRNVPVIIIPLSRWKTPYRLRSVRGGRAYIALSTDNVTSTHAELLSNGQHISIKFSATSSGVQEMEQIAVWFSSCSCRLTAVGTVSSWFKASPGMCMWHAVGDLTGRHDLLPASDYTAYRSPWALSWFTSVFSPKLHFFFCPSSLYFPFFLSRAVFSMYPLIQLLAFHCIIVLVSFQFPGIQKFLVQSFSPDTIIFLLLALVAADPNLFESIIVKCVC